MNVETAKPMRVLGGKNPRPYWDRFNRLQARAELVLSAAPPAKGVFRFKSWDDFNEWKMSCRTPAESPGKTIS
jgi:hypothetical protein